MSPNPSQTTRRLTEIAHRRDQVAELYLHGMSMNDISRIIDTSNATVSRDLFELRKEWLERSVNHIDQKKAIELAKLDNLEVTYWNAWERSMKDAEVEIVEQTGTRIRRRQPQGENEPELVPERIRKYNRKEGRIGDSSFLEGVLKCIAKRCEILGVNAPTKIAPTDPSGMSPLKHIIEVVYTEKEPKP